MLSDAQVADLMAGMYYVNIHTDAYPAGEIRGQLVKSP
jgi:CHRD domain-containing protein